MLFLAIILLLTSLAIAGVAAYFSIVGLSLLFVGSGVAIIIMGSALEVGKLITVSVLHQLWSKLNLGLKVYLFIASFLLMVITSLGIYGFLSNGYNATSIKVHSLEQSIADNNKRIAGLIDDNKKLSETKPVTVAPVIETNKDQSTFTEQQLKLINQKESRIAEIRNGIALDKKRASEDQANAKSVLDSEITKELSQIQIYNNRLQILDKEVQTWLEQGTGGLFKQNGLEKARLVKESQQKERDDIDKQIKNVQSNIETLRFNYTKTVQSISKTLEDQIKVSESSIQKVEQEIINAQQEITNNKKIVEENQKKNFSIAQDENLKFESIVKENKIIISNNEKEIQNLQNKNKEFQTQIISTDVGTFKFVSKSIGVELDKTVNWFILLIISVFDPLAVALLLCFNHIIGMKKTVPVVKQEITPILPPVPSSTTKPIEQQQKPLPKNEKTDDGIYDMNTTDFNHVHIEQGNVAYKNYPQRPEDVT